MIPFADMSKARWLTWTFLAGFVMLATAANAERSVDTGTHVIHYNAISTDILTPQVASAYDITRSRNRALVNIAVMKKVNGVEVPSTATVTIVATNLTGQRREVDVQLVEESDARYYIGVFRVANQETINFLVTATPEGAEPVEISFRQQFYTD